jgi:hypothetical protein
MAFKHFLPRRRLRLLSAHAQRGVLFWLGGIVVGGAAVVLALLANQAQDVFQLLIERWHYASLLVTPLGLGLIACLTRRVFPNSQGSGIPQAIAARHHLGHGAQRDGLARGAGLRRGWRPAGRGFQSHSDRGRPRPAGGSRARHQAASPAASSRRPWPSVGASATICRCFSPTCRWGR